MADMDPNAFLMSGGAKSAAFKNVGDQVQGTILSVATRQQTEPSGKLKTYDDGNPMMQLVVTVLTNEHEDEDDDGLRALYVKGQMRAALRAAILKAGEQGIAEGGEIVVRFSEEEPPKTKGFNPTKVYKVGYRPPARTIEVPADDGAPPVDDDDMPFAYREPSAPAICEREARTERWSI